MNIQTRSLETLSSALLQSKERNNLILLFLLSILGILTRLLLLILLSSLLIDLQSQLNVNLLVYLLEKRQ